MARMTDREIILNRVFAHSEMLLGNDYSRTDRMDFYPGGSADCSSYTGSNWSYGGLPLIDKNGKELWTSCYQVYAKDFDLIYPASYAEIGKHLPKTKVEAEALKRLVLSLYQPGDIVFDNFDIDTPRSNKITHVRMINRRGDKSIHTANNREKCCEVSLSWGATHVCAIIRLKKDVKIAPFPELFAGIKNRQYVRMLQIILNTQKTNPKLTCDGSFGSATVIAVNKVREAFGFAKIGKCDAVLWMKFVPELYAVEETPVQPPTPSSVDRFIEVVGGSVWIRNTPAVNGAGLTIAHKTERYKLLGTIPDWYQIEFNGKSAYISSRKDLTKVCDIEYVQVLGGSVYVRAIGSDSGARVGTAHRGEKYMLLKIATTGWYKINFNGKAAYISNRVDLTKVVK